MLVREKVMDKGSVIILDIRQTNPQSYDALHIFKAQPFSMVNVDYASLKAMIHFKHVFLVGDVATDFESNNFIKLA